MIRGSSIHDDDVVGVMMLVVISTITKNRVKNKIAKLYSQLSLHDTLTSKHDTHGNHTHKNKFIKISFVKVK